MNQIVHKSNDRLQHDLDHYTNRLWAGNWDRMKIFDSAQAAYKGRYVGEIARADKVFRPDLTRPRPEARDKLAEP